MNAIVLVPFMAVLNRFRGGGFGADKLPGHPRFYAAPILFAHVWWLWSLPDAIAAGVSYLVWSFLPWGHLIGLGRWDPPREYSKLEKGALVFAHGNRYIALGAVEILGMGVATALLSPWALVAAVLFVACYEIGWRLRPTAPIELAELLVGVVWAALLLVALSGCAPDTSNYYGQLSKGVGQQLEKSGR